MELQGDVFKPYFGLVNQVPSSDGVYFPVGRLIPWKMNKCTIEEGVTEVPTDNNAVPHFETGTSAKRKLTGTIHHACFDNTFNIFGSSPHAATFVGAAGVPFSLYSGMIIRAIFQPAELVAGPRFGSIAELIGVPILGLGSELQTAVTAPVFLTNAYIMLAIKVTKIRHEADASAGQPFDFDWHAVAAFAMPNESTAQITAYGFVAAVGVGGFF